MAVWRDIDTDLRVNGNLTVSSSYKIVAKTIELETSGEIRSQYGSDYIIVKDHNNGNVSLSAAGDALYLGYSAGTNQVTQKVVLFKNLYQNNATTIMADSSNGTLYYAGVDTDTRYLKLDGSTQISGNINIAGKYFEKYLGTFTGALSTSNQKVDIYWTGNFYGYIDVEITGGWNTGNGTGNLTKRLALSLNATTSNDQKVRYIEAVGGIVTSGLIAIGDASYDSTNSRWKIPIAIIGNTNSPYTVKIKGNASIGYSNIIGASLGSIYTTDTTAYSVPKLELPDETTVKGELNLDNQASAITHAVRADRLVSAGTGLLGGGNLTADRTISVDFGSGNNQVASGGHLHDSRYMRIDNVINTATGALNIPSIGSGQSGVYLPYVGGAAFVTTTSSFTGAIKITLPVSWSNTMMRFAVDIYEYSNNESFTVYLAGYNNTAPSWYNTTAYILGNDTNRSFTVRFGHDGTKCCIYIGELNSTWAYPQITVRDFFGGYSSFGFDTWNDGWVTSFESSAFGTVTSTISDCMVKSSYALNAGKLNNVAASDYLRSSVSGQSISGNLSITGDGNLWVGSSAGDGDIIIRDSSAVNKIRISGDGEAVDSAANVHIDGTGLGVFKGTLSGNTLQVGTSTLVDKLNSQYLNGLEEVKFAKNESVYEMGGHGVYTGLAASAQAVPNMTVAIASGTYYTNSGRRFTFAGGNVAISAASATYGRKDVVYIRGSSHGANEGQLAVVAGTPSASPVTPSTPYATDIVLAIITVPQNIGSIQAAHVADAREWKPFRYTNLGFYTSEDIIVDGALTTLNVNSISVEKPFKATGWATTLTIAPGDLSATWTHNLGLGTSYVVTYSTNSPNRHIYWSSKATNSISFFLDESTDIYTTIDVVITAT